MEPTQPNQSPAPSAEQPALAPESQPAVAEVGPQSPPVAAPSASPATPVTVPAPAASSPPATPSAPATGSTPTPTTADDGDVIEKEWVDAAEKMVDRTAGDPHAEEAGFEDLQVDYIKKRFGKDIKEPKDS